MQELIPPSKSTKVLPPHRQLRISSRATIWRGRSASSCSTRNGCGWIFSEIPALRSSPIAASSSNCPKQITDGGWAGEAINESRGEERRLYYSFMASPAHPPSVICFGQFEL